MPFLGFLFVFLALLSRDFRGKTKFNGGMEGENRFGK